MLVSILTFHKRAVKFIPNLVKHISIITQISYKWQTSVEVFEFDISLFASQYNVVSIVNRMQVGWLRHCSSVSGRGNRFHKVSIPAWGPSSLLFSSFTEGYSSWCCNLTRHFRVVELGLRMSEAIYPFHFQAFMVCMETTLHYFNLMYFIFFSQSIT